MIFHLCEWSFGQLLDSLQHQNFRRITEGDCGSRRARPRRAANTMHVAFRVVRHFVVDDVGNSIDVDPPGNNIRRDQYGDLALVKRGQRALPRRLALVRMDGICGYTLPRQLYRKAICTMLGSSKHQNPGDSLILQHVLE